MEKEKYLTPTEVTAAYPTMTVRAQNSLRHQRKIKYARIAGRIMYKPEWIADYVNSHTVGPDNDAEVKKIPANIVKNTDNILGYQAELSKLEKLAEMLGDKGEEILQVGLDNIKKNLAEQIGALSLSELSILDAGRSSKSTLDDALGFVASSNKQSQTI